MTRRQLGRGPTGWRCSPGHSGRAGSPRAAIPGVTDRGAAGSPSRAGKARPWPPTQTCHRPAPRFVTPQARAAAGTTPTGNPATALQNTAQMPPPRRLPGLPPARPRCGIWLVIDVAPPADLVLIIFLW